MPPEPDEETRVLMYTGGTPASQGVLLQQRAEVLNVHHVLSQ